MFHVYCLLLQITSEGFHCQCAVGYTGLQCEKELLMCEASPCFHGICVNQPGDYTCICEEGYTGNILWGGLHCGMIYLPWFFLVIVGYKAETAIYGVLLNKSQRFQCSVLGVVSLVWHVCYCNGHVHWLLAFCRFRCWHQPPISYTGYFQQ